MRSLSFVVLSVASLSACGVDPPAAPEETDASTESDVAVAPLDVSFPDAVIDVARPDGSALDAPSIDVSTAMDAPPLDVSVVIDAPPLDIPTAIDTPPVTDVPAVMDTPRVDSGPVDPPVDIRNPVINRTWADPFILRVGRRYHAFATAGAFGGEHRNIQHAVSDDLARWTLDRDAMPRLAHWVDPAEPNTWAPGVLAVSSSRYVLFYAAHLRGTPSQKCIGRAVSDTPQGPYVDSFGGPLICDTTGPTRPWAIDPSPFRAPNGNLWLVWRQDIGGGVNTAAIRRLADNGTSFMSGSRVVTLLRRNDSGWENPILENPAMIAGPGSRFTLFYSGNQWRTANYAVGYAVCDSPTGPCTRRTVDRPWFRSRGAFAGPGGEDFFTDTDGNRWMSWHAWAADRVGPERGERSLWIGRFRFVGGEPEVTPEPVRAGF